MSQTKPVAVAVAAAAADAHNRRERNRVAQQKHREKRKKVFEDMRTKLQKVKLAATKNDIELVRELVRSPSIVLPPGTPSTAVTVQPSPSLHVPSTPRPPMADAGTDEPVEDVVEDGQGVIPSHPSTSFADFSSLDLLPAGLEPFYWPMPSFSPFAMPFFDMASPLSTFQQASVTPTVWDGFQAITTGV